MNHLVALKLTYFKGGGSGGPQQQLFAPGASQKLNPALSGRAVNQHITVNSVGRHSDSHWAVLSTWNFLKV